MRTHNCRVRALGDVFRAEARGVEEARQCGLASDPVPALALAAAQLSSPARHVHQAVLAAFTATGQPPSAAELDRLAAGTAATRTGSVPS